MYSLTTPFLSCPFHPRYRRYKYFIFLNSSVRGPFLPTYMPPQWQWTRAYTDRLVGDVKAVSSSLVCLPEVDAGGYGPKLESWAFAVDQAGLAALVNATVFALRECKLCQDGVVVMGEYGLTASITRAGYNIDTLMAKYRNVSHGGGHWMCTLVGGDARGSSWPAGGVDVRGLVVEGCRLPRLRAVLLQPCSTLLALVPLPPHSTLRPPHPTHRPSTPPTHPPSGGLAGRAALAVQQQRAPLAPWHLRWSLHASLRNDLRQGLLARGRALHLQIHRLGPGAGVLPRCPLMQMACPHGLNVLSTSALFLPLHSSSLCLLLVSCAGGGGGDDSGPV